MKGLPKSKRRNWTFRVSVVLFLALILGFLGWSCWVYVQIENYAGLDQTAPSDAIGVLGAAEYDGRPSRFSAHVLTTRANSTIAASHRSSSPWAVPAEMSIRGCGGPRST